MTKNVHLNDERCVTRSVRINHKNCHMLSTLCVAITHALMVGFTNVRKFIPYTCTEIRGEFCGAFRLNLSPLQHN